MTRKRILNVSSRKKHDTMRNYTNLTNVQKGGEVYVAEQTILDGNQLYALLWCPTSRTLETGSAGNNATVDDKATRTATEVYMRGLKEKIQIQTSSGAPWQWRRVCFTLKGNALIDSQKTYAYLARLTGNGYMRVTNSFGFRDETSDQLYQLLFQGQRNIDWHNFFSAKLDTNRVTVKYDKTIIIQSGNASGVMRSYNRWHPMNKTLVYDDDERGGVLDGVAFSVDSKRGMGDYYVCDFIGAGTGSTTSDHLSFDPTATLYWHER